MRIVELLIIRQPDNPWFDLVEHAEHVGISGNISPMASELLRLLTQCESLMF